MKDKLSISIINTVSMELEKLFDIEFKMSTQINSLYLEKNGNNLEILTCKSEKEEP